MRTLSSICLLFLVHYCLTEVARSQTLLLDNCSINVCLEELHKYYSIIRPNAVGGWYIVGNHTELVQITSILTVLWFLWISDHSR